ncbi:MAG: FAD:protein FMN transferase [Actinomycetota bacterium]
MGSEAHVRVLGGDPSLAQRARDRLADLEQRWSRFLPDSEISRLGRSAGRPQVVSAETFEVVAAAVDAWRWSGGAFDPTVADTMVAAGYRSRSSDSSAADEQGSAEAIEYRPAPTPIDLTFDPYPCSITVPAGVAIDLGGIGKGAAADLVAGELLDWGAAGCCVNVGGDLRVAGEPPRPAGWLIDIDLGPGLDRPVVGVIDGAVCTSTRNRRTWTSSLGHQHHLRDPADGSPLETGIHTVTVIGPQARQAEILTKTAFAAGPEAAGELITGTGATGLLVTDADTVIELDGLGPFVAAGAFVDSDAGDLAWVTAGRAG